ncbi:lytic transglycosylase domain-containing protein [Rubellimicrobium aerolatum]|uniref:Lytic transglycosylase domain-containing protein n=1 Tax=Rubellimicrobium aerolatum TaxID=490979 RepID=A0ABW0SEE7_9RHOB|nr:lytic transglycosylase domain-containing protein [Rubellimicrobium aerolatum]MBP1806984.1 soluble lytic murein transglycosylase-like protein [Rubellimicrobium aerolatum]
MRSAVAVSALLLALALPGAGEAGLFGGLFGSVFGGGSVHDEGLELREEAVIAQKGEDLALQAQRRTNAAQALEIERGQLAALDRILASVSATDGSGTPATLAALEGDGTAPGSAAVLYGAQDPNPAAARLFGDANVTVEELIIQVAKDTAGYPGVAAAGLSPVQWRCLLQALIWQESRFQVGARSPAAAFGLTQIIPGTAQALGIYPEYYEDPYVQVEGGARYLSQQLQAFGGNVVFALAAYNAGPGAVEKYGGVPPFDETQGYVKAIPAKYNSYLGLVGGIDAKGTIDPVLLAGATLSLTADAAMVYGAHTEAQIASAATRLRSIVTRIRATADAEEAMSLNTYARAEVARLMVMMARLQAAHVQPLSAEQVALAAIFAAERDYTDFTLETLP